MSLNKDGLSAVDIAQLEAVPVQKGFIIPSALNALFDDDCVGGAGSRLPIRVAGILECIDSYGKFSFTIPQLGQNIPQMLMSLNSFYTAVAENSESPLRCQLDDVTLGHDFVFYHGDTSQYHRGRVLKIDGKAVLMRFLDMDFICVVSFKRIYKLTNIFVKGVFKHCAFVPCCLPGDDVLASLGLEGRSSFRNGDLVDVVICTYGERCLAVLGRYPFGGTSTLPIFRLTTWFSDESRRLWLSLLGNIDVTVAANQSFYERLYVDLGDHYHVAVIASFQSLDKVFIRDISSCIRLAVIQYLLNYVFSNDSFRAQYVMKDTMSLHSGSPCVVFDFENKCYIRATFDLESGGLIDVIGADYPERKIVGINVQEQPIYSLPSSFLLPIQCFPVKVISDCRSSDASHFSELAKDLLVENTLVSIKKSSDGNIVDIYLADGTSVLAEIFYDQFFDPVSIISTKAIYDAPFGKSSSSVKGGLLSSSIMRTKLAAPIPSFGQSCTQSGFANSIRNRSALSHPQKSFHSKSSKKNTNVCDSVPYGTQKMIVAHVSDYNNIFLRDEATEKLFSDLTELLHEKNGGTLVKNMEELKPGMVLGYRHRDGDYARLRIGTINENVVNFTVIDYGCSEEETFDRLRPLFYLPDEASLEKQPILVKGPYILSGDFAQLIAEIPKKSINNIRINSSLRKLIPAGFVHVLMKDNHVELYAPEDLQKTINKRYKSALEELKLPQ